MPVEPDHAPRVPRPSRRHPLPIDPRHPRYWPLRVLAPAGWLAARLPMAVRLSLSAALGWCWGRLSRRRRQIAEVNLALCFPELNERERTQLLNHTFESAADGLLETLVAWFGNPRPESAEIEGLELLEAAQREGGVLLVGAHFTTMELAGAQLTTRVPMDVIYRANRNAALDDLIWQARRRHYDAVMERSETRRILRRLRAGATIWYAADQDYGAHHSEFVDFFGVPAATINAAARLTAASGAQTLAISHFRSEDRRKLRLIIRPVDPSPAALSAWLEAEIRRDPAQYLWLHRRFKTRPPGTPRLYP